MCFAGVTFPTHWVSSPFHGNKRGKMGYGNVFPNIFLSRRAKNVKFEIKDKPFPEKRGGKISL